MPFSYPYKRGDGKNVSTPPLVYKSFGVKAIEDQLAILGLLNVSLVDGTFGWRTKRAVKKFQREEGLTADGVVGAHTLEALFYGLIEANERRFKLPRYLLHGIIRHESWCDPGAYYENEDSLDQGIAMLNSKSYPHLSRAEAFDPLVAIPIAAERLKAAHKQFKDVPEGKRLDCTIASYNSPAGARDLAEGKPISEKLTGYIAKVQLLMEEAV